MKGLIALAALLASWAQAVAAEGPDASYSFGRAMQSKGFEVTQHLPGAHECEQDPNHHYEKT